MLGRRASPGIAPAASACGVRRRRRARPRAVLVLPAALRCPPRSRLSSTLLANGGRSSRSWRRLVGEEWALPVQGDRAPFPGTGHAHHAPDRRDLFGDGDAIDLRVTLSMPEETQGARSPAESPTPESTCPAEQRDRGAERQEGGGRRPSARPGVREGRLPGDRREPLGDGLPDGAGPEDVRQKLDSARLVRRLERKPKNPPRRRAPPRRCESILIVPALPSSAVWMSPQADFGKELPVGIDLSLYLTHHPDPHPRDPADRCIAWARGFIPITWKILFAPDRRGRG